MHPYIFLLINIRYLNAYYNTVNFINKYVFTIVPFIFYSKLLSFTNKILLSIVHAVYFLLMLKNFHKNLNYIKYVLI